MKHVSIITAILLAVVFAAVPAAAQNQRLNQTEVRKGLAEMRNFKHQMFVKELGLTSEQQDKFFKLYDAMDDELMAVGEETRDLERKTLSDENASATECTATARALFDQKKREAEIENSYFDRFSEVLTPRQMVKLKPTERKISLMLANYHGRVRGAKGGKARK